MQRLTAGSIDGNGKPECASFSNLTFHPDLSFVALNYFLGEIQSHTQAGDIGITFFNPVKSRE